MELALNLGRRCSERQDELRAELGLSRAELTCLRALPQEGTACGDLARAMGLSPSRSTRIVDGLVKRGLAERRPDGEDRRRCIVVPTGQGATAIGRIAEHMASCERSIRAELSPTDQTKAARGMRLMLEALEPND